MGNFYRDNKDIAATIDALDLSEVATLLEENFRFAEAYDFAPKDAASASRRNTTSRRKTRLTRSTTTSARSTSAATSWRTASPRSRKKPTLSATR